MESMLVTCPLHDRLNEMVCLKCQKYLCPECVTGHESDGHGADIVHILDYTQSCVVPKIDTLKFDTIANQEKINDEGLKMIVGLQEIIPKLLAINSAHTHAIEMMKTTLSKVKAFSNQKDTSVATSRIIEGIKKDIMKAEKAMKSKNTVDLLRVAQRTDYETIAFKDQKSHGEILKCIEKSLEPIMNTMKYSPAISALHKTSTKCQFMHLLNYQNDWRLDRKFLSTKMFLSEDNLTFGNKATNGYPGIIGDLPFESGLFAYEVIPHHLCCSNKDGFGIIEYDRYLAIQAADNVTPTIYDFMIGYLWTNVAKNMRIERICPMQLNSKYYVRVNLVDSMMTISGPGVLLTAQLKPGVTYVPAFSCGCSSNRMKIRPLDSFDEGEI